MTDEELKRLEQAWRSSEDEADRLAWLEARLRHGEPLEELDPEDGAAVLEARVDAGQLSQETLGVVAHAGLAAARLALGLPSEEAGIGWAAGFAAYGPGAVARAVVALARMAVERLGKLSTSDLPRDLLDALEAWGEGPTPVAAEAVGRAAGELAAARDNGELLLDGGRIRDEWEAEQLLGSLTQALIDTGELAEGADAPDVAGSLEETLAEAFAFTKVEKGVGRELIAWALRPRAPEKAKKKARPYAPKTTFAEGDVIEHPKFGVGTVKRATRRWFEADFPGGVRRLAHGMG
ncbi:MAG: hypothetical protein AB7N76_32170 [Planctomycetota bacterium]